MKDIQSLPDSRQIPVEKVGIKGLLYPIVVLDRENASQSTTARFNMYVDLPQDFKGTHMSRFVEILNMYHGKISIREIEGILSKMTERFESRTAHLEIRFPYFIKKTAPVSGSKALMEYECAFYASKNAENGKQNLDLVSEVCVPVTTLCPCSKEISARGAHNQRSVVTIQVRTGKLVWLEDLIELAEEEASAPLFPLLKREDEKWVTEHAYDHPQFVEDVVRSVAVRLREDGRIRWFQVESENFESIHNHNAYALVSGGHKAD